MVDTVQNASSRSNYTNTMMSIGITQVEFWVSMVIMFFLSGIISAWGNTLIVIGIVRSKILRNRFFIMLGYLLIARIVLQVITFPTVLYRVLRTLNMVDLNIKAGSCYILNLTTYFGFTWELVMLLMMVIDRTLAIACPIYYRKLNVEQAVKVCGLASIVTITLKVVPSLIGEDFSGIIPCVNSLSPTNPIYNTFHLNLDVAIWILILVIYMGLMGYVRFGLVSRSQRDQQDGEDSVAVIAYKRQIQLLDMLQRLVIIHCGSILLAKIAFFFSTIIPSQGPRFIAYGSILSSIDYAANVLMLLVTNKDLRQASLPCFFSDVTTSAVQQISRPGADGEANRRAKQDKRISPRPV